MGLLRSAQVEPSAAERGKPPVHCNACKREGQKLAHEIKENQELWLCVNYRDCNEASKAVEV